MNEKLSIYKGKTDFLVERVSYFNEGVKNQSLLARQVANGVSARKCVEIREEFKNLIAAVSKQYTSKKVFIKKTSELKNSEQEASVSM